MATLRVVNVQVNDSSSIDVTFTETLTPDLVTSNISIISDTLNVPDSLPLQISITGSTLSITCQPLTPLASYFLQFQSVNTHPFTSINGDVKISEDGVSNRFLITAPLAPDNPIKNYLNAFFQGNIYNNEDESTVVAKYINSLATTLARALYDIRQVKNENYLSFNVIDEFKTRSGGPFDRLDEEGAYEILRVGATPAGATANSSFTFDFFPSYPVTLQKQNNVEVLTANSVDKAGFFDINSLILNLSNKPVTKVTSIVFTLNTVNPIYIYDIPKYGYQILDSRYDQDFGFTYLQLEDNQIKLNDQILADPLFSLNEIIRVDVQYESKSLGVVVDPSTVNVFTTANSVREVLPPIENIITLKHAPITDASNNIPNLSGVTFIDPNSNTGAPHPAFKAEIPFRLNSPPVVPGQYAVDYSTGTVYVYGADSTNDGTGPYPPLATYKYRLTYQSELDYVYDPDSQDLVALPTGSLVNFAGTVTFKYEQVFVPGVDYKATIHNETLQERIQNRLVALNAFKVVNSPITNVFKIYNETSGEIYALNRWDDDKVYFRYSVPPRFLGQTGERATFQQVTNEVLFVNTTLGTNPVRIFKIFLNNNNIINGSEDGLATSFNSSAVFSNGNVFVHEKWFDKIATESVNLIRLTNVGEYMIDYANGVIYVRVSSSQGTDLGTVTYRIDSIVPQFPHVISVDDIYYRISVLDPVNKQFPYISFTDGSIIVDKLDPADERFLNGSTTAPYFLFNGAIGTQQQFGFLPGVTNQVKYVRSVYEINDLLNSTNPFNFAHSSTSNGFNITVNPTSKQLFSSVQFDGSNHYVTINENIQYFSPNITYTFSVVRVSDSQQLYVSGNVLAGDPVKLILTANSPQTGDQVNITYTLTINNISSVVVDYNKGDFFVDYSYLADEIIVSYEYGDNAIDFRHSTTVSEGDQYYVSYRAGALRDALLKNFGTLVNVPELATFDVDFQRERYRDALTAALTSFIQGPTVAAIKNIAQTISHIEPQVIESAFINWSLGQSLLFPEEIKTTGEFSLLPAKFGNGVLMDHPDQTISFPVNSNIRFEEGTFETWIIPQWNGLDNDARLTFNILKNGVTIPSNQIFIGVAEHHPDLDNGSFVLDKMSGALGTPNTNKDGVFIYYDKDMSGNFFRWYVRVIDGYVSPTSSNYKVTITSTGSFYDNKSMVLPKPSNLSTTTGVHSLTLSITGGSFGIDEGVTFLSDLEHYLLDFGDGPSLNRVSIFKDVSGYMNFRAYDSQKHPHIISADVSNWRLGDTHHVAASWKFNSRNGRDEMHLFIDGFEVPNIIKYGQKLQPYLHEKFRTVDPEEIIGLTNRDIVGATDLSTNSGSNIVTSSLNFTAFDIQVGNTIFIDVAGFSTTGYTITTIAPGGNAQSLQLSAPMPATVTGATFSINRTSFIVTSDIDIAPNIAVTTMHKLVDGYINGTNMVGVSGASTITSAGSNFVNAGVQPGYLVSVDGYPALEPAYTILQVTPTVLTINGVLPISFGASSYQIYPNIETEIPGVRAVRPAYSISKDGYFNNILTVSNSVIAGDLLLLRTLGLNHRKVKKQYYVWSDQQENILMTQLPPPISLDEAKIVKVILPPTLVGPSNSTLMGGIYQSPNFPAYPPSNQQNGRTISVNIAGTNADFSTPVQVTINGQSGINTINETLSFTNYGTQNFVNLYNKVNYLSVSAKPINPAKNAVAVVAKEAFTMTHSENSGYVPIVRYSYNIGGGSGLYNVGPTQVRDDNFLFSGLDINNYLIIHSPASVAGFYVITGISADRKTLTIQTTNQSAQAPLPNFTGGVYQVLNVNEYRSGLQNGFFTFETSLLPGQTYFLDHGLYELEYFTYTDIRIAPGRNKAFVGSDFGGHRQFNGIISQMKIYSTMLTDTRVGESIPANQRSITKDFNSLKALKPDTNTLMLVSFDIFPFTNTASFYVNTTRQKTHFQSSVVINENFGNSLVIQDKPIILENTGILDTQKQGTIEFWVSPLIDTGNDPTTRYYFDAYGAVVEETVSINNAAVKISAPASKILSVKLKSGNSHNDYFAGGSIDIDTTHALQETVTSIGNSSCLVSRPILQVISVKIIGDLTNTDYFANGSVGSDQQTIFFGKPLPVNNLQLIVTYQSTDNNNVRLNSQVIRLNKSLPYENTKVVVNYIPEGLQGDRMAIFKDKAGFINFAISASGTDFIVRGPTRWVKNTWHRVKASYKINSKLGADEVRLFLDGYQYSNITYGSGIVFGQFPFVFGSSIPGDGYDGYVVPQTINFKDSINNLFIGSQYTGEGPIFSLFDNFRISNVSRPIYAPYGESLDVNYNKNLSVAIPVTSDLFTTFLMDFDEIVALNDDFAVLKNRETGNFDFSVNVLDSFGIIKENIKSQEALEALIKVLKPANSRVFIQYIR